MLGECNQNVLAWNCIGSDAPRTLLEVEGECFGDSYSEADHWMREKSESAKAWIVILAGGTGAEAFLNGLPESVTDTLKHLSIEHGLDEDNWDSLALRTEDGQGDIEVSGGCPRF